MSNPNLPDSNLLKTILEPLLDDFQYWFERSRIFLETQDIPFLTTEEQADLLARVSTAQQEVSTARMLFDATDGQVGIEASALTPWHNLVTECWQVVMRFHGRGSTEKGI